MSEEESAPASITFSPEELPVAIRGKDVNETVTVSVPGTISSLSVVLSGEYEQEAIVLEISNTGFTITGKYIAGWQDVFTYVEANESDQTDTPKTAIDIPNMPPDKNLYDLNQDKKQSIFVDYNVTVVYEDEETFQEETLEGTLTHQVDNDLEAMRLFMDNYNYNGGEL
jgi:hypothetical protein